jgi:hypothetical protein
MSTSCRLLAVPTVLCSLLTGCAVEQAERGDLVGSAEAELVTANTVTANTVTANTLVANTLTNSGIGGPVLTALQDTTPIGTNNRTIFHYIVTCALSPAQSVTYTWSDGQGTYTVTEQGQLGLAPQWATGSLKRSGQQLVSGCIAARVNYFGVTVPISARNCSFSASFFFF